MTFQLPAGPCPPSDCWIRCQTFGLLNPGTVNLAAINVAVATKLYAKSHRVVAASFKVC